MMSIGKSRRSLALVAAVSAALFLFAASAGAQSTLKMGLTAETLSLDPQFSTTGSTQQVSQHIFDTLVTRDKNLQIAPGLALSWTEVNPLTWEIKLRQGVKFHDGRPFTSADVLASIARIPNLQDSASSYKRNIAAIKETVAVDAYTVRFLLKTPSPQLAMDLSFIYVISGATPATATTDEFNKGKYMVGTGPFKFVEWVRGDRLVLEKNPDYWGKRSSFDKVILKPITSDPSRVAALLAGDVDIIDQVSPVDQDRLRKDSRVTLFSRAADRMMYLHMDTNRDKTPFIAGKDGKPLDKNPLKDIRVRQALSLAINRDALTERVLNGAAEPTGQFVPEGMVGYIPEVKADPYDPEKAKKLLAEAGYPNGFSMTLHGSNDRFLNDEQVTQAIGQFFARVGIDIKVQALPYNVFTTAATNLEYSIFLIGFGNTTGDAARGLTAVLATFDKALGTGANNRGRYSNPEFDKLIKEASLSTNPEKREAALQEAVRIAIVRDKGIIPLYIQTNTWAVRKGLSYEARMDEYTMANTVTPVK